MNNDSRTSVIALVLLGALASATVGCGDQADPDAPLIVYAGRTKSLIEPVVEKYTAATGRKVLLKDGKTSELTATLLEEGDDSPADVFWAQDAGALGALEAAGMLADLPTETLSHVPEAFRSRAGTWVGISGRARVVTYNTGSVKPDELPDTIFGFTDPRWKGRIGWPPRNGSFQAFVTSLRVQVGEDRTREWLLGIQANEPKVYPKNSPAVAAVIAGEIDVAFVNHYYLFRKFAELGPDVPARNHTMKPGDPGNLVNVAGAAVLKTSKSKDAAQQFIDFLLGVEAQQHFANETFEYPLVEGVATHELLRPLDEVGTPDVDLSGLADLEATLALLRETGILD